MKPNLEAHPLLQAYLDQVCAHIRMKEVHDAIREELLSHLLEIIEARGTLEGESEDQVIQAAILQMGNADVLGKQFNGAHKPKKDYGMMALVAGMILFGLVTLFAVKVSLVDGMLEYKLVYGGVGIAAMVGMYFADYRKILHFAEPLYAATVGLLMVALWQGVHVNGANQWIILPGHISIPVFSMSPYLLIIAIAGMLLQGNEAAAHVSGCRAVWMPVKQVILYMVIPLICYIKSPALVPLIVYGISLALLLLVTKKWKLLAICCTGVLLMFLLLNFTDHIVHSFLYMRYTGFLHPNSETYFLTGRSLEAIRSAGLWGHGIDVANDRLPFQTNEFVFSYLIYSFGWVFGWCAGLLVLLFIVRMYRIGLRINDRISRGLFISLGSVICLELAWNLLMCLGLLPVVGLTMPIVNWSASTVIELAAVGFVLGVYRRKDLSASPGLMV
ncbi:cell division protein FtsW (lipid II flippase) [Paenibacillus taihuensis]|uniref:Cell division protein FtsW (Lipid II flippase) n=1 Tax=Paenibacillus taihuensis TaxID=1156355 RepID=A0A3D9SEM0_9BACL|nr:FtsW/RodA/SpoVE family cell cycle protein [Paenibacillus taihuensis]REE94329.1 cell division protein FtsW (lipid II flippase) [Paenibacillus taihuensis]